MSTKQTPGRMDVAMTDRAMADLGGAGGEPIVQRVARGERTEPDYAKTLPTRVLPALSKSGR
jgi:hypothetical protein